MSTHAAPRCRYIKVNGTQCGSPALRHKNFCFYHMQVRPTQVECYADEEYANGLFPFPPFEDAHSIQFFIRQVVQMLMQRRIDRKTASLVLYGLQLASSNLKRMELEKPQPEQVVIDTETEPRSKIAMAVRDGAPPESSEPAEVWQSLLQDVEPDAFKVTDEEKARIEKKLPPGTIQACCQPGPPVRVARTSPERSRMSPSPARLRTATRSFGQR